MQRVIVGTAVREKAIAHPSDGRLLEVARAKIVSLARSAGHQFDAAQDLDPEGRYFTGSDLQPEHLSLARDVHTDFYDHRHDHDASGLTGLDVLGFEPCRSGQSAPIWQICKASTRSSNSPHRRET